MRLHLPSATTVSIDAVLCSLLVMGAATEACREEVFVCLCVYGGVISID